MTTVNNKENAGHEAKEVSKKANGMPAEAGESKFQEFKEKAKQAAAHLREKAANVAEHGGESLSHFKEKAKEWTSDALEASAKAAAKVATAAHNSAEKLEH